MPHFTRSLTRRLLFLCAFLVFLFLPFPLVSHLEEEDSFCAACHTAPEMEYVRRSRADDAALDLSSAHYAKPEDFRCIRCHRGDDSWQHRGWTLALGARDAALWVTGRADPALEKTVAAAPQLLNTACVKCHGDALQTPGFPNHFHNKLPGVPTLDGDSQLATTTVTCIDCHQAHVTTGGGAEGRYLNLETVVYPACAQCHQEDGHGPLGLTP